MVILYKSFNPGPNGDRSKSTGCNGYGKYDLSVLPLCVPELGGSPRVSIWGYHFFQWCHVGLFLAPIITECNLKYGTKLHTGFYALSGVDQFHVTRELQHPNWTFDLANTLICRLISPPKQSVSWEELRYNFLVYGGGYIRELAPAIWRTIRTGILE